MLHNQVRLAILQRFETQSDFATRLGIHESKVSQVLRGRRKLSKQEAIEWSRVLGCKESTFKSVTKSF
jgi:plasmid maintenance system antidote protein VapI